MESRIYHLKVSKIELIAKDVAEILKSGGIAVIPTDTIYGIVALDNESENGNKAIEKIFQIKSRPKDKKLIRLIGDLKLLKRYTEQNPAELINKYWPGPLTIVFRGKNKDSIALRCPYNPFLETLFKYIGENAIVAPSANISSKEDLINCDDIINAFNGKVDVIVCYEKPIRAKASTIIDISEDNNWKILRQGELYVEV